ncbi:hypothetical protein BH09SUM1_BH09SUM1_26620 [soil metagenome]
MKPLRPILAIIAFVALVFYYRWDVRHVEHAILAELQNQQVLFQNPAYVTALEFDSDAGMLRLEKKDSEWRITAPRELPADQTQVATYLENLRGAKRQSEFAVDDEAKYGLDKPRRKVSVTLQEPGASAITRVLEFGSQPVQFGNIYARVAGEKKIFTVSEWLFRQSEKTVDVLRDKHICREDISKTIKLQINTPLGAFAAVRKDAADEWTIIAGKGAPVPADRALMDRVMANLAHGEFLYIDDNPTSTPLQLGLEKPLIKIDGDDKTIINVGGRVGKREQFFAQSREGAIGVVPGSLIADFFRPPAEWGTKRFIWFDSADIAQVKTSTANSQMNLMKDSKGAWIFAESPGVKVREDRVKDFLSDLTAFSALQFVSHNATEDQMKRYGFIEDGLEVSVTSAAGSVQSFKIGQTDTKEGVTYVLRTQDNSVWKIDFTLQSKIYKFRADLEERRMIPDVIARTAKFEIEVNGSVCTIEKKGTTWMSTILQQRPTPIPTAMVESFLDAFQEMDKGTEMKQFGRSAAQAIYRFYEADAKEAFAVVLLLSRNKDTGVTMFEMDGQAIEVSKEQFDATDDQTARILLAAQAQAQRAKPAP